jgi:hypothetical protein
MTTKSMHIGVTTNSKMGRFLAEHLKERAPDIEITEMRLTDILQKGEQLHIDVEIDGLGRVGPIDVDYQQIELQIAAALALEEGPAVFPTRSPTGRLSSRTPFGILYGLSGHDLPWELDSWFVDVTIPSRVKEYVGYAKQHSPKKVSYAPVRALIRDFQKMARKTDLSKPFEKAIIEGRIARTCMALMRY